VSIASATAAAAARLLSLPEHGDQYVHDAYEWSQPLEDMLTPAVDPVHDLNLLAMSPELQAMLLEPQLGARAAAKRLLGQLSDIRRGQFSMATEERTALDGARVFGEVPSDRGHFGVPYIEHVLRGLRTSLPAYMQDLHYPSELPPGALGGLVLVRL
jgi:hypothetical protein